MACGIGCSLGPMVAEGIPLLKPAIERADRLFG